MMAARFPFRFGLALFPLHRVAERSGRLIPVLDRPRDPRHRPRGFLASPSGRFPSLAGILRRHSSSQGDRSFRAPAALPRRARGRAFYCMPSRRASLSWLASFVPS